MENCYRFAGLEFSIRLPGGKRLSGTRALEPFAVEEVSHPHCFTFIQVPRLEPPQGDLIAQTPNLQVYQQGDCQIRYQGPMEQGWQSAHLRALHRGNDHTVQLLHAQFPQGVGAHTVLSCLALEHLLAPLDGLLLHASFICHEGKAILFTAPSGTGKSTQAELWRSHRGARILNGDRVCIRMEGGTPYACGIPFAGSSGICKQAKLPIAAIVCLSQAPQTTIRSLGGFEAFRRVWEGCSVNTWDREDIAHVSDTVMRVLQSVPVFHLACTPDETAITALEQMLRK